MKEEVLLIDTTIEVQDLEAEAKANLMAIEEVVRVEARRQEDLIAKEDLNNTISLQTDTVIRKSTNVLSLSTMKTRMCLITEPLILEL